MAKKTTTTDQRVLELLQSVKKKKELINRAEKPQWKTNCSFCAYDNNLTNNIYDKTDRVSIQAESNISKLISILGFILDKERSFTQACVELHQIDPDVNLLNREFLWMGFSSQDWISDISTRINKLQISTEKENLTKLEAKLDTLISPEMRRELELQEIENSLK